MHLSRAHFLRSFLSSYCKLEAVRRVCSQRARAVLPQLPYPSLVAQAAARGRSACLRAAAARTRTHWRRRWRCRGARGTPSPARWPSWAPRSAAACPTSPWPTSVWWPVRGPRAGRRAASRAGLGRRCGLCPAVQAPPCSGRRARARRCSEPGAAQIPMLFVASKRLPELMALGASWALAVWHAPAAATARVSEQHKGPGALRPRPTWQAPRRRGRGGRRRARGPPARRALRRAGVGGREAAAGGARGRGGGGRPPGGRRRRVGAG